MHIQESNNRILLGSFWISSPPRKRVCRSTFSATSFVVRSTSWRQQCRWVGEQPGLERCVIDEGKQRFVDRAMKMKIDMGEQAYCLYYPHHIWLWLCCGGNLIIWAVRFILLYLFSTTLTIRVLSSNSMVTLTLNILSCDLVVFPLSFLPSHQDQTLHFFSLSLFFFFYENFFSLCYPSEFSLHY